MSTDSVGRVFNPSEMTEVAADGLKTRPTKPLTSHCSGPYGPETRTASRRAFLRHAGAGFGWLALTSMLARDNLLADQSTAGLPETPRSPQFPARAERVIFLFMSGGPSHLETFDP